jgi:pimeloyl-ACP methyl ester carboxylesterase
MSLSKGIVCFSHGQESGPSGTKIAALTPLAKNAGWDVVSLDYRGMTDPLDRVDKLHHWCTEHDDTNLLLVGSSMGAAVAAAVANKVAVKSLFLMATAVNVPGYEHLNPLPLSCPATLVHGWQDEIIPYQNALRFALDCQGRFTLIDADHGMGSDMALSRLELLFGDFLLQQAVV